MNVHNSHNKVFRRGLSEDKKDEEIVDKIRKGSSLEQGQSKVIFTLKHTSYYTEILLLKKWVKLLIRTACFQIQN